MYVGVSCLTLFTLAKDSYEFKLLGVSTELTTFFSE